MPPAYFKMCLTIIGPIFYNKSVYLLERFLRLSMKLVKVYLAALVLRDSVFDFLRHS